MPGIHPKMVEISSPDGHPDNVLLLTFPVIVSPEVYPKLSRHTQTGEWLNM